MNIIATPMDSNKKSNPYNFLLYKEISEQGFFVNENWNLKNLIKSNIWHVHWPESFLTVRGIFGCLIRFSMLMLKILLAKIFRMKIIWTVHNVQPHESYHSFISNIFYKYFPRFCDGFIFLSESSLKEAESGWSYNLPKDRIRVIFHGHYKDVMPYLLEKSNAKKKLNISIYKHVYLFFGLIREYKNVPHLISEYISINMESSCLCIVGSTNHSKELSERIENISRGHDNIIINDNFVDDRELQLWLSASDVIVLPFTKITNSGSVLYALSAEKHVIAPKIGALKEIKKRVGGCLHLYEGSFKGKYMLNIDNYTFKSSLLDEYSWPKIAKETMKFYNEIERGN
jgi:beta-1,4-mannosyltransferase